MTDTSLKIFLCWKQPFGEIQILMGFISANSFQIFWNTKPFPVQSYIYL